MVLPVQLLTEPSSKRTSPLQQLPVGAAQGFNGPLPRPLRGPRNPDFTQATESDRSPESEVRATRAQLRPTPEASRRALR